MDRADETHLLRRNHRERRKVKTRRVGSIGYRPPELVDLVRCRHVGERLLARPGPRGPPKPGARAPGCGPGHTLRRVGLEQDLDRARAGGRDLVAGMLVARSATAVTALQLFAHQSAPWDDPWRKAPAHWSHGPDRDCSGTTCHQGRSRPVSLSRFPFEQVRTPGSGRLRDGLDGIVCLNSGADPRGVRRGGRNQGLGLDQGHPSG